MSLFRKIGEDKKVSWNATFKVDSVDVGATGLPKFDLTLFRPMVSRDGKTRYLGSKRPVVIEYSDIRPGKKEGRFFTNVISISEQEEIETSELDALLDGEVSEAEAEHSESENNFEF